MLLDKASPKKVSVARAHKDVDVKSSVPSIQVNIMVQNPDEGRKNNNLKRAHTRSRFKNANPRRRAMRSKTKNQRALNDDSTVNVNITVNNIVKNCSEI
jgi:hypothetical protein